jgi:hypothetical protein
MKGALKPDQRSDNKRARHYEVLVAPIDAGRANARPSYVNFRAVNPVICLR